MSIINESTGPRTVDYSVEFYVRLLAPIPITVRSDGSWSFGRYVNDHAEQIDRDAYRAAKQTVAQTFQTPLSESQ